MTNVLRILNLILFAIIISKVFMNYGFDNKPKEVVETDGVVSDKTVDMNQFTKSELFTEYQRCVKEYDKLVDDANAEISKLKTVK